MMRVIAGALRGRRLQAPKGLETRPVSARVREALFSILGDIDDFRVLDLFAGTGAVGIEALSRGAASAVFIEEAAGPYDAIVGNLRALGLEGEVVRMDVRRAVERLGREGRTFDFVFADPPYDRGLALDATVQVVRTGLLSPHGVLAATVGKNEGMPADAAGCPMLFDRRYGGTRLVIYGNIPAGNPVTARADESGNPSSGD